MIRVAGKKRTRNVRYFLDKPRSQPATSSIYEWMEHGIIRGPLWFQQSLAFFGSTLMIHKDTSTGTDVYYKHDNQYIYRKLITCKVSAASHRRRKNMYCYVLLYQVLPCKETEHTLHTRERVSEIFRPSRPQGKWAPSQISDTAE